MKLALLISFFFFGMTCLAQKQIKLEEAKDHIGDSVKVEGIISGVRFLDGAKNTPTFINVGGAYPNQLLTVVIWGDVRNRLTVVPSSKDVGNKIIVTGKVESFREKPQIVIKNAGQFEIIQNTGGEHQ